MLRDRIRKSGIGRPAGPPAMEQLVARRASLEGRFPVSRAAGVLIVPAASGDMFGSRDLGGA